MARRRGRLEKPWGQRLLTDRRARMEEIRVLLGPEPLSPLSIALEIYPEA